MFYGTRNVLPHMLGLIRITIYFFFEFIKREQNKYASKICHER